MFYGTINKGKPVNEDVMYAFFATLKDGTKIKIEKVTTNRSNNQNRYLWGVVYDIISSETGHTPEEVHDAMKMKFLQKQGVLKTLRSTATLTTVEFEEFVTKVRVWASQEMGLLIPFPNEVDI